LEVDLLLVSTRDFPELDSALSLIKDNGLFASAFRIGNGGVVPKDCGKAKGAILCYRRGAKIDRIESELRENLAHPLALESINVDLAISGVPEAERSRVLATLLRMLCRRLSRSELRCKVGPSLVPRLGETPSRRELLRNLFMVYRNTPLVDAETCLHREGCRMCIDTCPYGAIGTNGEWLEVSSSKCVECGLCATACFAGQIQLPTFNDADAYDTVEELASTLNDYKVFFTCKRGAERLAAAGMPEKALPVEVPCIAGFAYHALLEGARMGLAIALLCPDHECPARAGAERYVESLQAILGAFEDPAKVSLVPILATSDGLPRLVLGANRALSYRQPTRGARSSRPSRRFMLPKTLATMSEECAQRVVPVEGSLAPYFDLDLDIDMCTLCEACVINCPTRALALREAENLASLDFDSLRCTGCGICVARCPSKSMKLVRRLRPQVSYAPRSLKEDRLLKCGDCGRPVGPECLITSVQNMLAADTVALAMARLCDACKQRRYVASAKIFS